MKCRVISNIELEIHVEKLLSEKELVEQIGLSRVTLWRMVRAGEFPPPLALSEMRKGWRESAVSEWIETRPVADAYKSIERSAR